MAASKVSLVNLPVHLSLAGHDLTLDRLCPQQVPEAYQLVLMEVEEGHDMGKDEFASEEHFQTHISKTDSFGITDTQSGKLYSVIVLGPSAYCRSPDPLLADGIIICDTNIKTSIIESLIQIAMSLTIDLNYEGLLFEAFRTSPLVAVLRTKGFTMTGCIPDSGNLMKRGWTDSLIMYKELPTRKTQVNVVIKAGEIAKQAFLVQKPRLTIVPRLYQLSSGKDVILRYVRDEEIPNVYSMYKEASDKGHGYSKDEFESLEYFRYYVVDHGHPFIIEDPVTSKILVAFTLNPNEFCRSVNPLYLECYMVVDRSARRMRLASEISPLVNRVGMELGYSGDIGDTFVSNIHMLKVSRSQGFTIIGYVPKSAKGKDGRMEDAFITYKKYKDDSRFIANL